MKKSAGIVLYKIDSEELHIFLVHPGGPIWKNKDLGSWSIPKGEFDDSEIPLVAAIREFEEETGTLLSGDFTELNPVKMKSGKRIYAWAHKSDIDPETISSNTFEMEWPPKSGKLQQFPEVDRGQWCTATEAIEKINPAQADFINQIEQLLRNDNL